MKTQALYNSLNIQFSIGCMMAEEQPNSQDSLARPWPCEWMIPFLLNLRVDGNVSNAAKAAGVSRATALGWRGRLPRFRSAWDEAIEDTIDELEAEARRRALSGSDMLLWKMLSSLRRQTYGERIEIEHSIKQRVKELAERYKFSEKEIIEEAERILSGESELAPQDEASV